ncbi:MAG: hypothetical protein ACK4SZ_15105 [Allosphingosinicella sp.]|uniref:hypothetical protein n=1 Tax=Allosphingosinicella sp. TaxID=2823234 RepID=UPI0039505EC8
MLGQAYLLAGKSNVLRIDPPESDRPIALDGTVGALRELPLVARSQAESSGHYIDAMFLHDEVEPFVRCPPEYLIGCQPPTSKFRMLPPYTAH